MRAFFNYPFYLFVFAGGWLVLRTLIRSGRPTTEIVAVGVLCSAVMGWITFRFTSPWPMGDFLQAYLPAGEAVRRGPEALAAIQSKGVSGFVNLPIVAWLFAPFSLFTPEVAGYLFTTIGVVAVLASWWFLAQAAHLDLNKSVLLFFVFAANGPLFYSAVFGNISHMLLLPLIAAFLLWRDGREFPAGLLLGASVIVKPPLLLLGVFFALRARWRVVAGCAVAIGAVVLASILWFGWNMHVQWYQQCIVPFLKNPIPAYNVQTPAAFFARLELGGSHLRVWKPCPISPLFRVLTTLSVGVMFVATIVSALPQSLRPGDRGRAINRRTALEIEFFMALVLSVVTSTLSWSHYYVWFLVPMAFVLGETDHIARDATTTWLSKAAILLLTLPVFPVYLHDGAFKDLFTRTAASYLLLGGMLFLLALIRSRWSAELRD